MAKPYKSIWNDFLTFSGILPITLPERINGSVARVGHPHACLESYSKEEIKDIRKDADRMRDLISSMK